MTDSKVVDANYPQEIDGLSVVHEFDIPDLTRGIRGAVTEDGCPWQLRDSDPPFPSQLEISVGALREIAAGTQRVLDGINRAVELAERRNPRG